MYSKKKKKKKKKTTTGRMAVYGEMKTAASVAWTTKM